MLPADLSTLLAVALAIGLALAAALVWVVWKKDNAQRDSRRRVATARVRAGHIPDGVPTTRGSLGTTGPAELDDPSWASPAPEQDVVDEQPRIHVRYIDINGKKNERIVQVERLDLKRAMIYIQEDESDGMRRIRLKHILAARMASSGERLKLDVWVEAVRSARRRRGEV